jgi:signal transduction histidine kinase
MQPVNLKIVRLAYWLIRLRWYAIIGMVVAYSIAKFFLHIKIWGLPVYCIISMLILLNTAYFFFLKNIQKSKIRKSFKIIKRIINFQISADLVVLTVLLHYSGGVENPFIIYYIFHMIIGSIVLSTRDSVFQTSFALLLLGTMTFSEYAGLMQHFPLEGFIITNMYCNLTYIISTGFIFITTSYFVVYITRTIILESNKHEIAYIQANLKLKQKDKIKDEYVMRITHDIKGHIAAIKSCINVLKEKLTGPLNPQQEEFIDRAHNRIEILNKFINDLLSITQRKLQRKPDKSHFDFGAVLEGIIKNAEHAAQEKNITITKKTDPLIKNIYGERSSIEEVLLNLLTNAVKYSKPGTEIKIRTEDRNDKILVEVTDSGIGVPEEELKLIFNEFYRASNVKNEIKDGTGLGLAISKQIVEDHGGRIWAVSKLNEGSTFSLCLRKDK